MTLGEITSLLGLDLPGRRVLIVEDNLDWLRRLAAFWEAAGHLVTAVAGISEVRGDVAEGPGEDGRAIVRFSLRDVDAAFLDYYIQSQAYNGALVARELSARGVTRIFGMSSVESANAAMRHQGALATMRKAEFIQLVASAPRS